MSIRLWTVMIQLAAIVPAALPATAEPLGLYYPLTPGAAWTYADPYLPNPPFTVTVFEQFTYQGHPAFRTGRDLANHQINHRDGGTIRVYAQLESGVVLDIEPDLVLGEFTDGARFPVCVAGACDTTLIRVWSAIEPGLRGYYPLPAAYADLIALASFDTNYPPNQHSVILASRLPAGAAMPTGAVTSLEWYQRRVGLVAQYDLDAATGDVVAMYHLSHYAAVGDRPAPAPGAVRLSGEPNPFNPRTTLRFELARAGVARLELYDAAGRRVLAIPLGELAAGLHEWTWDGRDEAGHALASGAYLARLTTAEGVATLGLTLLR